MDAEQPCAAWRSCVHLRGRADRCDPLSDARNRGRSSGREKMREDFASGEMMRLELEKSYGTEKFSRTYLTEQYGIRAVRGPRYVPDKLFRELMKDG